VSLIVVKCGGAVAAEAAHEVHGLAAAGHQVCVVHGAGPQISEEMRAQGLDVRFVGGRRVTTPETMVVVRKSLKAVNRQLCEAIGARAVGLMGDEIGLPAARVSELGLVGDALPSQPRGILTALEARWIPVVAPLAVGPLNVNADEAAAALAIGLGADRLVFVTNVPGVLVEGAVAASIDADETDRLLAVGAFNGGIVPKLRAAVQAARGGVRTQIGQTVVLAEV
jgi:acetylglutamate kinase